MSTSTQQHREAAPNCIRFAEITISDTRTLETDTSGTLIVESMTEAGHELVQRQIVSPIRMNSLHTEACDPDEKRFPVQVSKEPHDVVTVG